MSSLGTFSSCTAGSSTTKWNDLIANLASLLKTSKYPKLPYLHVEVVGWAPLELQSREARSEPRRQLDGHELREQ